MVTATTVPLHVGNCTYLETVVYVQDHSLVQTWSQINYPDSACSLGDQHSSISVENKLIPINDIKNHYLF